MSFRDKTKKKDQVLTLMVFLVLVVLLKAEPGSGTSRVHQNCLLHGQVVSHQHLSEVRTGQDVKN